MLTLLLTTLLPALIPAGVDIVKGAANKFFGGAQAEPANFADYIELRKLDIQKLQTLAELDKAPQNISIWVANLRASSRYVLAFIIIIAWFVLRLMEGLGYLSVGSSAEAGQLASIVFFFLFGDRMNQHFNSKVK